MGIDEYVVRCEAAQFSATVAADCKRQNQFLRVKDVVRADENIVSHEAADRAWQRRVQARMAASLRQQAEEETQRRRDDFKKHRSLEAFGKLMMRPPTQEQIQQSFAIPAATAHPRPFLTTTALRVRTPLSGASQRFGAISALSTNGASSSSSLMANYCPPPTTPPVAQLIEDPTRTWTTPVSSRARRGSGGPHHMILPSALGRAQRHGGWRV
jgi:hypothetical protein